MYIQFFQLTAQNFGLTFPHVSATKRSHLQRHTTFDDIYSVLYKLSVVDVKMCASVSSHNSGNNIRYY